MKYLKWIPNFLTSMSVFMGSLAIVTSYQGDEYLIYSAVFIAIAAVFDFSDGFAARMLKAGSEMGKELDSLADMVSFGVAPALLMHHLIRISLFGENATFLFSEMSFLEWIYVFLPFSIAIFSALRLAKFNIDTRQTSSFIGMPTPAGAISVIALVVVYHYFNESFIFTHLTSSVWFLLIYSVVVSGLLVSELPMFSLKAKNLKWKDNPVRLVFLILLAILFIVFKGLAIVFFIPLYLVMSIINYFSVK
jgi:CDP-diacylglycerol--serine O-phosphatidyltransferase